MRVSNVLYNAHDTQVKRVLRYPRSKKSWKFASNIFLGFSSFFSSYENWTLDSRSTADLHLSRRNLT